MSIEDPRKILIRNATWPRKTYISWINWWLRDPEAGYLFNKHKYSRRVGDTIQTLGDLADISTEQLYEVKGLNAITIGKLQTGLGYYGLHLRVDTAQEQAAKNRQLEEDMAKLPVEETLDSLLQAVVEDDRTKELEAELAEVKSENDSLKQRLEQASQEIERLQKENHATYMDT